MLESCYVELISKLSCFLLATILPNKIHLQDRCERQSMVHLEEERTRTIDYTEILPFWWSLPSLTAEVTLLDCCTLPQMLLLKSPANAIIVWTKHTLHGDLVSLLTYQSPCSLSLLRLYRSYTNWHLAPV